MNTATPAMQDLAWRLIARQTARAPSDGLVCEAVRGCEELGGPPSKLAGVDGLRSLLARDVDPPPAHQMVFASAPRAKPALYFTVLGEPAIKMLRYQQQFRFFDPAKLNTAVRFVNLSEVVLEHDLDAVLEEIVKEVEAASPAVV